MKKNKYYTVGTVTKYNRKIVERGQINTPTYMYMIEETATLDVPTERPKIIGCFQSDIEQEFLSLDVPTERPKIIGCFHSDNVHICGGIDLASFYYLSIIFCNCSDCVVFLFFSFSTIKYKLMKPVITNVVNCHVLTLTQSSKPHRWCNG
jgi:hypothetical protein